MLVDKYGYTLINFLYLLDTEFENSLYKLYTVSTKLIPLWFYTATIVLRLGSDEECREQGKGEKQSRQNQG